MRINDFNSPNPPPERPEELGRMGHRKIWGYFKALFAQGGQVEAVKPKSAAEQIKQDLERISERYRNTIVAPSTDLLSFDADLSDQIYQTTQLSDKVRSLEELGSDEKSLLLAKIEGVKKGLIEIEKHVERELQRTGEREGFPLTSPSLSAEENRRALSFVHRFLSLHESSHLPQQKPFTKKEIEELDALIARLKPTEQLYHELAAGRQAITDAQAVCTELLQKVQLAKAAQAIPDLMAKIQRKPRNDLKEMDIITLKRLADLYWGFNPPFGISISIDDYAKIQSGLESLFSLDTFLKLTPGERTELHKGAIDRIKRMRQKQESPSPRVTIVGGGPGGLTRGLVAAASGAKWELIEKRERTEGRKNVVKIDDAQVFKLLLYFGAADPLASSFKTQGLGGNVLNCSIGNLEAALVQSLSELTDANGKITTAQAVDVHSGVSESGQLTTEVLIKGEEKGIKSDLVVFADGAKSVGSKIIGSERETYSTPTTMFAISIENCKQIGKPSKEPYVPLEGGIEFDHTLFSGSAGKSGYATVAVKGEVNCSKEEYQQNAAHFMKWLGFQGGDVTLARPFRVEIGKAAQAAAVTKGDALILSSGDAYATPDPAAAIGCSLAIRSAILFADALRSWKGNKDHALIREEQNYAMDMVYNELVRASFKERQTYTAQDTKAVIAVLRQAEREGKMPKEMVAGLNLAFQKQAVGAALTEEDIRWLKVGAGVTKREPFRMPDNTVQLPHEERVALWKKNDEFQKESWKEWLNGKIQEVLDKKQDVL